MSNYLDLSEIIEPAVLSLGFDLVRVKMIPSEAGEGGMALQVMAEDPKSGQLVLEQCALLSRRISEILDDLEESGVELVEGAYHLEVSSPGIDRPLTRKKDFANWVGHEAKLSMVKDWDGKKNIRGILKSMAGDLITISDEKAGIIVCPFDSIHSAKLILTEALISATQPLDASKADDVIEEQEEEVQI